MHKIDHSTSLIPNMRWFGDKDPVSLSAIKQTGAEGVVSALHHVENGQVWEEAEIRAYKEKIEAHGLRWEVVESLPVHESIKLGNKEAEKYIASYKLSIQNLARQGIQVITYNFMPILDWTRTDLKRELPSGASCLSFDFLDLAIFDLFVLQRVGARNAYSKSILEAAEEKVKEVSSAYLENLSRTILAGLPGSEEHFELNSFRQALTDYADLGEEGLRKNLYQFIAEVAPIAESYGIKLAIHPDDPPFSLFGLARVVSTEADLQRIVEASPSLSNGFCFCSGSLGSNPENDLRGMMEKLGKRIHFLHLRNVKHTAFRSFYEAPHLEGDVDMPAILEAAIQISKQQGSAIPFRPDHGLEMLDDQGKKTNPGYTAIGRSKGMAEIRGLELGIRYANDGLLKPTPQLPKN